MAQSTLDMFAIAAPGCEPACAKELAALDLAGVPQPGGVTFRGELADLYRANLWLRSASRVLVRFAELSAFARDADVLVGLLGTREAMRRDVYLPLKRRGLD